ncbi:glycosyltransferase family 2 protein [Govanella unica]|uniref:Glycosyltransferase family 2 protein n=1 Tax=Govanella unica TaxID=2975056 RepID=A0A9X3TWT1_9PROT|nr:glycosyltransferase family 2 protein [Govania unica]MDA5193135.1 glycosyltransferase family 2 protein [Govania unica]
MEEFLNAKIAVVIPCYKVKRHVLGVIAQIGLEVAVIYCVDDGCPEQSGKFIEAENRDPRVRVLYNPENRGVGGAVITGYKEAIKDGMKIAVKLDGDGQMDPSLLPRFVLPIMWGEADYAKGNRFFNPDDLEGMPTIRLFGNAVLSFLAKLSSGYWSSFDPTNGYTAVHTSILKVMPLDKLSPRYFFETDMLFRLSILRAVVADVPMQAVYGDEISNLRITRVVWPFFKGNMRNFWKRIVYNYFLRDFQLGSATLGLGVPLVLFAMIFGGSAWVHSYTSGMPATAGTVMLAGLSLFLGLQFLLTFLNFDIQNVPKRTLHPLLEHLPGGHL